MLHQENSFMLKDNTEEINVPSCRRVNNYAIQPWIIHDPCLPRYGRIIVLPWRCNLLLSLWSSATLEPEGSPKPHIHPHVREETTYGHDEGISGLF